MKIPEIVLKTFESLELIKKLIKDDEVLKLLNHNPENLAPRIVSSISEKKVIDLICKKSELFPDFLDIESIPSSEKASFYDFSLKINDIISFVNIKIVDMTNKADNASGWGPIYYLITGKTDNITEKSLKSLKDKKFKIKEANYSLNYYFFIIDKNTGEIFINSLKTINEFVSNPANAPFQINWTKNKNPNFESYFKDLYLKAALDSLRKKEKGAKENADILASLF